MFANLLLVAMMAITSTDQTVQVAKGTKLDVNNFAGDVTVKVWDKDAVRVEVNNSDRETVDIKTVDQVLRIRSRSTRGGPPRSLDYTITVPSWMAIPIADKANVALTVRTYNGSFRSTFPIGDPDRKNKRFSVTLGNGSAHVELESFGGAIALRRPSDPRPETERKRRSDKDKEKEKD